MPRLLWPWICLRNSAWYAPENCQCGLLGTFTSQSHPNLEYHWGWKLKAGHEPNTITFSATVSACEKVRLLHWHHEVLYSSGLVDEQKPNSQICVDEQKFYI